MALAEVVTSFGLLTSAKIYPRRIMLPERHHVYLSDTQTIFCTIPELYLQNEYELHSGYQPQRGWRVLDAGDNVGLFSLRAAKHVIEAGRVVSFEPNPVSFYWLTKNISLNGLQNVDAYPIALGNREGTAQFNAGTGRNIRLSSFDGEHMRSQQKEPDPNVYTITVPVRRLDALMKTEVGDAWVDLMKIDVEGSELDVIRGASGLLNNGLVQKVVVEVHLNVMRESDMVDLMKEHNLRIDRIARLNEMKEMIYARVAS